MATTQNAKIIEFKNATITSEAKELNPIDYIVEMDTYIGIEDAQREWRRMKRRIQRERKANKIAEYLTMVMALFCSMITMYFGMMFIYKVFHPATLEGFLFISMIWGFITLTFWGLSMEYIKDRIYRKR